MESIQPSWHIARLSLLGRPSRTILIGISVALASTLVVTVSCALTTAVTNIDARLRNLIGEADARVVHEHGAEFDAAIIDQVRALPSVIAAGGRLYGSLSVRRADDPPVAGGDPPRTTLQCRGTDLAHDQAFAQLEYRIGRAPLTEDEVGIDPLAARILDAQPGTKLEVVRFGDPIFLTVSGVYERAALGALQRPAGHLSRRILAEASDRESDVVAVSIVLAAGVDTDGWVAAHATAISLPLRLESIQLATSGLDRSTQLTRVVLALGTMLAFLCCALLVATAMTTALSEQQRAFAVARCVGASRGQLFCGQLIAGSSLCAIAGAVGIPLGIATAAIVVSRYREHLPAGLSLSWLGVALAMAGSILAGVIGSLWPAWSVSRISILKALGPQANAPARSRVHIAAACGLAGIAVQLTLLALLEGSARFWCYVLVGLPLLHLGWFLLSVPTLGIVATLLASGLERMLGIPRGVLRGSLAARRWRFGLLAGALMLGVSVLVSTWADGGALLNDIGERVRFGDAFAFKSGGFSAAETSRLQSLPGVTSVASVGYLPLKVIGDQVLGLQGLSTPNVVCIGFDSTPFLEMNRLAWIEGDPAYAATRLREGDAILVAPEFQIARGIGPGSRIELGNDRDHHTFEVVGVVGAAGLDVATQFFGIRSQYMEHAVSCVFMDFEGVSRYFGTREAFLVQMGIPAAASDDEALALAAMVENAAPGAVFASGRAIRSEILRIGSILLTISTTVALGALALASLAAASVIAAGVATRSFELGVLEAVGASRGLVCRLLIAEAVVIGATAAVIGTVFGTQLAWVSTRIYRDVAGLDLALNIPIMVVVMGGGAVCLAAILATLPAVANLTRQSPRALLGGSKG
ncbi:MAG: ABC transporter permease [Phycisphaerales bacterium]|nr:ABC transporter permease [Phycisphaerales bacterium]